MVDWLVERYENRDYEENQDSVSSLACHRSSLTYFLPSLLPPPEGAARQSSLVGKSMPSSWGTADDAISDNHASHPMLLDKIGNFPLDTKITNHIVSPPSFQLCRFFPPFRDYANHYLGRRAIIRLVVGHRGHRQLGFSALSYSSCPSPACLFGRPFLSSDSKAFRKTSGIPSVFSRPCHVPRLLPVTDASQSTVPLF